MYKLNYLKPEIDGIINMFKRKHNIDDSVRISWKINKDKLKNPRFFVIVIESEGLSMMTSFDCSGILSADFQFYTSRRLIEELDSLYKSFLNTKN